MQEPGTLTTEIAAEGAAVGISDRPAGDPRPAEDTVFLPRGLPGFPRARRFRLETMPHCGGRFLLLELLEEETLSLIVMPADLQAMPLARDDIAEICGALEIRPEDLCLLLVVTLAEEEGGVQAYVNLRAPIFLDTRRRLAAQMVLPDAGYPLRHPLQRSAV